LAVAPAIANGLEVPEPRLAVGRSNGVVELWDTTTWHLHSTTAGHTKRSIRSFLWVTAEEGSAKQRLFSAGLHREVSEWDLTTLTQLVSVASGGGPVWSLSSAGMRIFAACEDGTIRIFSAEGEPGDLMLQGRLNVGKTRLLSVAYFGNDFLFAGGSDSRIAKWSMQTRTCEAAMQVEKARGAETLVWSLVALGDHGLASGDSLGLVHIWDPVACVVRYRFAQHQADVLTLAASPDGSVLLSSGVDAKISAFSKQSDGEERWVSSNAGYSHTHDVRAIAMDAGSGKFVSGGVSGVLQVHQSRTAGSIKRWQKGGLKGIAQLSALSPVLQTASIAQGSRLMLCQRDAQLELWYLQQPKPKEGPGAPMPEAQHVLRVSLDGAKEGRHLAASAIAPNGQHFAASDDAGTRLFQANLEDLEVRRVRGLPSEILNMPARALLFCGSGLLASAPRTTNEVVVLDVGALSVVARLKKHKAPVALLATEGEWLASSDLNGVVHIFSLDKLQHHAKVPLGCDDNEKVRAFPTALCFDGGRNRLIVALSTHKLIIFDVEALTLAQDVPSIVTIPPKTVPPCARVCGISAPPAGRGKLLLWGHSFLVKVDLKAPGDKDAEEEQPKKKKKRKSKAGTPEGAEAAATDASKGGGDGNNSTEACVWKAYEGMQHIVSLHPLEESQWGAPLLDDPNSNAAEVSHPSVATANKKRLRAAFAKGRAMVLTLEVAPVAIEKSLPQSFERKSFTRVQS